MSERINSFSDNKTTAEETGIPSHWLLVDATYWEALVQLIAFVIFSFTAWIYL